MVIQQPSLTQICIWQRFRTYKLPLHGAEPEAISWMMKMWEDPVMKGLAKDYHHQAENPDTYIRRYEDVFKGNDDIEYGVFDVEWVFEASI